MQLTHKTHVYLLASLLVVSAFTLTGCRTGGFTKPDLARLAFWKKDAGSLAAKSVPPPPARHFDPAPINGDKNNSSEVVDLDGRNLQKRFDNNINQALDDIKSAAKEPMGKTHSTDSHLTGNEFSPNGLAANSGNVKSKLNRLDGINSNSTDNTLSAAQKEFQAAMNATQSKTDGFATKKSTSNEFNGAWKEDIKLPTGLAQTGTSVDQSLASVNQSLNNANRQLADVETSAAGAFQAKTNDFKNNVKSQFGSATESANNFVADAQAKMASTAKPNSNFASKNNFAPQYNSRNAMSSSSLKTNSANSELDLVQAQVAEAKQQIERLKMQVEDAKRKSSLSAPTERVAQLQTPNFKSAYANPGSIGSQPTNVLRSKNQPASAKPTQPLVPQTQPSNFPPSYPSTPHGNFAPKGVSMGKSSNLTPQMNAASSQASFESSADESKVVTADSRSQGSDSASRIQNYVSEVDIPDSVLKGAGSYAPGSVNALKK